MVQFSEETKVGHPPPSLRMLNGSHSHFSSPGTGLEDHRCFESRYTLWLLASDRVSGYDMILGLLLNWHVSEEIHG
ncbi:hypothetical protein NUU61_007108 [Penicillium alfredii]|uniref:Uncharacterized protein n=1 Tax=Penicillium alfredii TaxID=1506179 RepID=A0A9W9F235_9EURO|nr:uncharacterized protein NUU61_007108 [Penicillium alfredii]KAJ5092238.1 hypothetical protein NUU61_007108 [Penicillium alfredii]